FLRKDRIHAFLCSPHGSRDLRPRVLAPGARAALARFPRARIHRGDLGLRHLVSRGPADRARAAAQEARWHTRGGPTPLSARRYALRTLAYAWAAPTTAVGLTAGALTLVSGGRVQYRRGTLEFHGGFSRWFARRGKFSAMTLGHVIIGHDARALDACREHE